MDGKQQDIRDIPSLKKMDDDAKNLLVLKKAWPKFRPLLKALGADVEKIDKSLVQVNELASSTREHVSIPDKFNDIFSKNGWILYSRMNMDVVKEAIKLAKSEGLLQAENLLLEYYSAEQIERDLNAMIAVKAFQSRMPLAEKALFDFQEGRFYSTVLVVLSLLDGMVNEIQHKGFFSGNVDLIAWDSIAAHSKGLQRLKSYLYKSRKKTTTEEISLPYRNGIMHGMDLGYDNRAVAVKTWVALFATRDWALKAERGELEPQLSEKEKTLGEVIQKLKEVGEDKKILANWEPRKIILGKDIPSFGELDRYENGSPEQKLVEFLHLWSQKNYGFMRESLSIHLTPADLVSPKDIREIYDGKELKEWKITNVKDELPYIILIGVEIIYEVDGKIITKQVEARMLYEDKDNFGVVPPKPNGRWFIVNYHFV